MLRQEIISRRSLPHWYVPGAMHFVTFRLAGTLPREVIDRLAGCKLQWLNRKPEGMSVAQHRNRVHKRLFAAYDKYLEENRDINWLSDPRISSLVRGSLYFLHGKKYNLLCYCILPNHVHVLFLPYDIDQPTEADFAALEPGEREDKKSPLSSIMHSLKGYTAHEANKTLKRSGAFWQHESYDHWVRDEDELERLVQYIISNPCNANLAPKPQDWYWGSAHDRYLTDGDESGWLSLDVGQASPLAPK